MKYIYFTLSFLLLFIASVYVFLFLFCNFIDSDNQHFTMFMLAFFGGIIFFLLALLIQADEACDIYRHRDNYFKSLDS